MVRMWMMAAMAAVSLGLVGAATAKPVSLPPAAIFTDPPADAAHPARAEVLHIPSGGVAINGLAYIAAGPGPHPTLVLLHGYPGNEKNLDLAQAVRRAGWNVVTFNYRGCWGSPGVFSFAGVVEDAAAALIVRSRGCLRVDTHRLVLGGHSMGGWGAAVAAAADPGLRGVILISAADMATVGATMPPDQLAAFTASNSETLAGVTPQNMAAELLALGPAYAFPALTPGLTHAPMLVLSADDGLAPATDKLAADVRAPHGRVTTFHAATDHGWNSARILLESQVIRWLQALPPS